MEIECPACKSVNRVPWERLGQRGKCGSCKERLPAPQGPFEVDPQAFDAVIKGAKVPVLVDFWAPWCGPCRMAAPQVEKAARELGSGAVVLKVNTQDHPQMSKRFNINGIPHFMVFKGGQVATEQRGLVPAHALISLVQRAAA